MISWLRQLGGWTPRGRFRLKLNFTTAIVAGLVLRLLVAAYNGFIGPSFGANSDALAFHFMAEDYARNLGAIEFQVGWIYSCFLAFVYALTFDSLFIGCVMSCLTWLTSAWVLARLLRLLAIPRAERFTIGLLYAFLPSSILYTGVTLREPYQLLFVNLAIYSALMIAMKKPHGHQAAM